MSVAFDAEAHSGAEAATSIADFTLTIGGGVSNGAVVVWFAWGESGAPTGITITVGGNTASAIPGTQASNSDLVGTEMFGLATGSDTGAQTISVSWTGTNSCTAVAVNLSGVDQTTPFQNGAAVGYDYGETAASLTITSATNNMTLDGVTDRTATTPTGPSQTSRWAFAENSNGSAGSTAAGAASNDHDWTIPGARASHSGVDIRAAAAPSGQPTHRRWDNVKHMGGLRIP